MEVKEQFSRTAAVLGVDAVECLRNSTVAVFGVGGVGGFCVEALARAGVGRLVLFDGDTVAESNINRQIIATHATVGRVKVEVMKERIAEICPDTVVETNHCFYLPEQAETVAFDQFDYIVDAIDTVTAKIDLVLQAEKYDVPIIASMGTGNKLDPTRFQVADIYETSVCPLARVMRRELKKRGVKKCKVLYSTEEVIPTELGRIPGSVSFVPPVAGMILAGEVIKDLIGINRE